jgi:hypothetical protein
MTAPFLGLLAAITAAFIGRSVMVSNHRQAWINGLRKDLAAFFTAIDLVRSKTKRQPSGSNGNPEEPQKERNDAMLAYRKILMRLNMNEALHLQLERSLESLLTAHGNDEEGLKRAVTYARGLLKHEWDVTKYGPVTAPIVYCKARWRRWRSQPNVNS